MRGLRIILFAMVGAVLLVALERSLPNHPEQSSPAPTNLILISIDTLRADHLGAYGYPRDTSPNLDRLAARSSVFERAVAQAPNTKPSHASLFTSLYYSVHRVVGNETTAIPSWRVTLPEILQANGIETAGFVDGGYLRRVFGFAQGFDHYEDRPVGIARILQSVDRWFDARESRPFFLFVHCYDVHTPYQPPAPFDTWFEETPYAGDFEPTTENLNAVFESKRAISDEDLEHVVARYDGGIRYTDAQLGGFFEDLEDRGLLDTTIVIVTSDHGEAFMEHGSMLHWQTHFNPNLHVPLLVFVPGHEPARIATPVELIDVLPTALELLGLPPHPPAMGQSLVADMEGRATIAPNDGIAIGEPFLLEGAGPTVISDRHQLFFSPRFDLKRLYDTKVDPRATTNIASREPETTERLMGALAAFEHRVEAANRRDASRPAAEVDIDDSTRDQLRALGYLEDSGPGPATARE
jgi:arylsulfatase A-like enzyme